MKELDPRPNATSDKGIVITEELIAAHMCRAHQLRSEVMGELMTALFGLPARLIAHLRGAKSQPAKTPAGRDVALS